MSNVQSLRDCRRKAARIVAGLALGAGLTLSASLPAQAVQLPHDLPGLTNFYLMCLGLALQNSPDHDKICGNPGPAAPGDNENDGAGPGAGKSCKCVGFADPQFTEPQFVLATVYYCCQSSFVQADPGGAMDFNSLQDVLDFAPAIVPDKRGMDATILPAI